MTHQRLLESSFRAYIGVLLGNSAFTNTKSVYGLNPYFYSKGFYIVGREKTARGVGGAGG